MRIRALREILGLSVQQVAESCGISVEEYEQYESGTVDIPIALLYSAAHCLRVDMAALLTGDEPKLQSFCLTRSGKGLSVNRREAYDYEALAATLAHKKAETFLVTVPPLADEDPYSLNTHSGQEFHYMLEGVMRVMIDGHEFTMFPGDSVFFDSSKSHGMKAVGNASAKFLCVVL